MSEEEKKELQELLKLLYNDHISQYGKRKLEKYIQNLQKENELAKQSLKQNCDVFDKYNQLLVENQELKAKYEKALTDLVNSDNKIIYLNKVIDIMVRTIMTYDIEEDICSRYGKSKDCNDFEKGEEYCINCIKEHFYKEVENEI